MASKNLYKAPGAERPSVEHLQVLAEKLNLHMSPTEVDQTRGLHLRCTFLPLYEDITSESVTVILGED